MKPHRLLLAAAWLAAMSCIASCAGDSGPGSLPPATQQAVDDIVESHLATNNVPGAVVLLSIPGQGEMVKAYGRADLRTGAPRTTTDPFRIASITKTFIATLILTMVDDGS